MDPMVPSGERGPEAYKNEEVYYVILFEDLEDGMNFRIKLD